MIHSILDNPRRMEDALRASPDQLIEFKARRTSLRGFCN